MRLNSIRTKLILGSLLLLTVPLIVLGVFGYNNTKSALDDEGAVRLKNSVEMTLEMIEALNDEVVKGNLELEDAQEKVKVAVLGERDADGNRPIDREFDIGASGYIFIVDQEGGQVAHPFIEGENSWEEEDLDGVKFVQEAIRIGGEGGGLVYYDWPALDDENRIEQKVTYAKTDPYWDWNVNASTYMTDFNSAAKSILSIIFITVGVTVVVGMIFIILFANSVSRPLNAVTKQMAYIAGGDLSQAPLTVKSKDETGQLANALNDMQVGLRGIIESVANAATTMTTRSEELTQASNEVSQGTDQIVTTMEELAIGAESQASRSSDLSTTTGNFLLDVEAASGSGADIRSSSENVLTMTEQGRGLMDTSTKQMEVIDDIVQDAVEKVEGLDTHAQEISELVSVIHDIAEQTNLLALNAAIEAARAGEHGQGFAVVADEVRKLAEESSHSVVNITEIVNRIQNESSAVANSLRNGYGEVEQGTEQIMATGRTFTDISSAVSDMVDNIQLVSDNLNEVVKNTQQVGTAIEDIVAVSEQSAAGVEETTATIQQTNASMQEIAGSSDELSMLAEQLNDLVEQFKL